MRVKIRSELIKQLRTESGWTQEQLAENAFLHSRTIQRVESEGAASLQSLHRIAKALGVDPDRLEYSSDTIDFGPVLVELRIVLLAIARKLMPVHDRPLPNSFVALVVALSFGATFTLVNALRLTAVNLERNLDNPVGIAILLMAICFSIFFVAQVLQLVRLRPAARAAMLGICWFFFLINGALLLTTVKAHGSLGSSALEYVINLGIVFWIYRVLVRADVRRLFEAPEPPPETKNDCP